MPGPEREEPKLCQKCQEWLCSSKDAFCAYCGTPLVVIKLSEKNLVLSPAGAVLNITNLGIFNLYWAAEILSPEPVVTTYFSIRPDYGSIAANSEQAFLVRLTNQTAKNLRAEIEIASNDPHRPILTIPLLMEEIA